MGIQIISGAGSDLLTVDTTTKAARTAIYPPFASNGRYRLSAVSGLMTTIAARTSTAGHVFAWRWGAASPNFAKLLRINCSVRTIAGFTAAQEFQMALWRLTGYTGSHTGATGLTLTSPEFKKDSNDGATLLTDARIANTGALTSGTHTFLANPVSADCFAELAAAATVPKGRLDFGFNMNEVVNEPMVFRQNEGFVITNEVLMGAGGTARLIVQVDWIETTSL